MGTNRTTEATTRAELLSQHRAARLRRDTAALDSDDFRAACEEIARIEVAIARLEREMTPPRQ
jgi:hypothetical protein